VPTSRHWTDRSAEPATPESASRAINEYLAVLDDAAFGAATPVTPKFSSPADPASRWTGANKGLAFFAYATERALSRVDLAWSGAAGATTSPRGPA